MEIKTKAQYSGQVREEHLTTALSAPDAELKEWSLRVYSEFRAADNAWLAARTAAQELDRVRQEARSVHRRKMSPENTTAWRASVTAAEEANKTVREVRGHRNYLSALSELLATLCRERRAAAGNNDTNNSAENTTSANPPAIDNDNFAAQGTSTVTRATTSEVVTAAAQPPPVKETCPFCTHAYTVRDGTLPQVDAEGNRLQLRKCMCRELAPPCKNCPTCKNNAQIMKAKGEAQSRLCRDELRCEICACECPGAGKWVQGDADSRARFRERTARRHNELSTLLQGSWDDSTLGSGPRAAAAATTTAVKGPPVTMRRLPQDIKDQIIAAHAAESLFSALDSTAAVDGGSGGGGGPFGGSLSGAATTSAHTGAGGCGRMCCGEAITTVKRRKIENDTTAEVARVRRNATSTRELTNLPALPLLAAAPLHEGAKTGSPHHHEEGCGDHSDHDHVHRCDHPHDECNSGCCSAVSNA